VKTLLRDKARWREIKLLAASFAAASLAGCVTASGPTVASLASAGAAPAGKARIVVMRPDDGFTGCAVPVKIDGQPVGELRTGGYASVDRPVGRHRVSAEFWDVSRQDLNATAGRTYYFAVKVKRKHMAAVFSDLASYGTVAAATNDNTGPFELIPMSEAEAKQVIAQAQ
jgi:Protein of unknown function (DUF2846)